MVNNILLKKPIEKVNSNLFLKPYRKKMNSKQELECLSVTKTNNDENPGSPANEITTGFVLQEMTVVPDAAIPTADCNCDCGGMFECLGMITQGGAQCANVTAVHSCCCAGAHMVMAGAAFLATPVIIPVVIVVGTVGVGYLIYKRVKKGNKNKNNSENSKTK